MKGWFYNYIVAITKYSPAIMLLHMSNIKWALMS